MVLCLVLGLVIAPHAYGIQLLFGYLVTLTPMSLKMDRSIEEPASFAGAPFFFVFRSFFSSKAIHNP